MVEIKNIEDEGSPSPSEDISDEGEKYRLLYSKSKVYVQPTAYAKDNIPGFVVLVKRVLQSPVYSRTSLIFMCRRRSMQHATLRGFRNRSWMRRAKQSGTNS